MPYPIEYLNFAKQQKAIKICIGKEILIRDINCLETGGSNASIWEEKTTPHIAEKHTGAKNLNIDAHQGIKRIDLVKRKLSQSNNHATLKSSISSL